MSSSRTMVRPEEVKLEKLNVLQGRTVFTILVVGTSSRQGIGFFIYFFFLTFLSKGNRIRLE